MDSCANFLSNRVVNEWNKLPTEVVDSSAVNQFKSDLINLEGHQILTFRLITIERNFLFIGLLANSRFRALKNYNKYHKHYLSISFKLNTE